MSSGKIALLTGGNRGLGKNTIIHLAKRGVNVIFTYNSHPEEAEAVVKELESLGVKAIALQFNVTDFSKYDTFMSSVKESIAKIGGDKLDILINNAGAGGNSTVEKTTMEEMDEMYNLNFKSVFFLIQNCLNILKDGGKIITISSGLTRFCYPGRAPYASMKGGIEVLTKYLAQELGPRGISVNCVAPGATATDFSGGVVRDNPKVGEMVKGHVAMGRLGQPDDIGPVIAQMCMDEMGWITAQRIEVSGGQNL